MAENFLTMLNIKFRAIPMLPFEVRRTFPLLRAIPMLALGSLSCISDISFYSYRAVGEFVVHFRSFVFFLCWCWESTSKVHVEGVLITFPTVDFVSYMMLGMSEVSHRPIALST